MNKRIIIVSSVILLFVWLFGVIYVNTKNERPTVEYYSKGEIVEYGENYFRSSDINSTDYSITVLDYDIISYDDFVTNNQLVLPEYDDEDEEQYKPEFVYDVKVRFSNKNSEGSIDMFDTAIVNNKGLTMRVDEDLWDCLYPQLAGSYSFKLRNNTEMEFHLPFVVEELSSKRYNIKNIQKEKMSMVITQYPIKKVININ